MVVISSTPRPRSCCFWVFLCLIIVTCLLVYIFHLMLWNNFTSLIHVLPKLPAFQPLSEETVGNLTAINSTIEPFLHNTEETVGNPTAINSTIEQILHNISKQVKVTGVDCSAIFNGSRQEIAAAKKMINNASTPLSDSFYVNETQDCANFQQKRGYIMSPLTAEEEEFALAYSIITFKDSEMVERLLRAIYRPQNVYCIHVDQKSPNEFFTAVSAIANCFPNVFIASRRVRVVWGKFTVLDSELVCLKDLWKYRHWKYFINLTGQEFPLKTNHELVKILSAYHGAVDVISSVKGVIYNRFKGRTPPHGLRIVKGAVHIAVNREFVDFILHNKTSQDLLRWAKRTNVPDETYFAMLNSNPQLGIRGTYTGEPEFSHGRSSLTRFKNWGGTPCAGKRKRNICILTTGDLPLLGNSRAMFANKFYLQDDRVAIGCLEEKVFNDTRDEYLGVKIFNATFYENLVFVLHKVE